MTKRQTNEQIHHQQNLLANCLHNRQLIHRLNNEETNKQTNTISTKIIGYLAALLDN